VWYFEHPYPAGQKSYNKGKPIHIKEFDREKAWWNNREENEYAWRVPVEEIVARNYNLDISNPRKNTDKEELDVASLMERIEKRNERILVAIQKLKAELL
jgi:type I restriction enzyme M protein